MKTFVILFAVIILGHSALAEDYPYFITDDGHLYQDTTNGQRFIPPSRIEEAKKAKDSRPAEQDQEGNWGLPQFGCQVSLRFAKAHFSINEPIVAKLIVRNVSKKETTFSFRPASAASCITVIGAREHTINRIDAPNPQNEREAELLYMHVQGTTYWLGPGIQRIFELDLRNHFDLAEAGCYVVYARPMVLNPASNHYTAIKPSKATILIDNSSSSPTNSAAPRPPK